MRLIDAEEFEAELLQDLYDDVNIYNSPIEKAIRDTKYLFALDELKDRKTISEVVPVIHGQWTQCLDFYARCSECGQMAHEQWILAKALNYCPNCGAKMHGE